MSGDRPAPTERPARGIAAGSFRATSEPNSMHRVAIEVTWLEQAKPDEVRRALADTLATAFGEFEKRYRQHQ